MATCNVNSLLSGCFNCLTTYQLQLVQAQMLCNIQAAGGGGGAGAVAAEGDNFCFTGTAPSQVLRIKNTDTGLGNRIDTFGADGAVSLSYGDGVAC